MVLKESTLIELGDLCDKRADEISRFKKRETAFRAALLEACNGNKELRATLILKHFERLDV